MLKRDYPTQYCPVASTLEVIGERWTLLIIRDVFLGIRRFEDLQRDLGVARNVLQARLERLVEARDRASSGPTRSGPLRCEYRLTEKGADLWPVLVALLQWGDRYALEGERPMILQHRGCGGRARRPPPLHGVRGRRLGDRGHRHPHRGDDGPRQRRPTRPGRTARSRA